MKKTNSIYYQGKKLLLSSVAATALGTFYVVPKVVKADSTSTNQPIVNTEEAKNEVSSEGTRNSYTSASPEESSTSNTSITTEEDSTSNTNVTTEEDSTSNTNVTTEEDVTNAKPNSKSKNSVLKDSSTEIAGNWMGLTVTYDTASKTLTIPKYAGTIYSPGSIRKYTSGVDITEVEKIIFSSPLKISGDSDGLFMDLDRLKIIENLKYLDTSKMKSLTRMFCRCSKLESLDVSAFDTSNVINMWAMFDGCTQLTSLDVSTFDTSKVKNMSYMFHDCVNLNSLNLTKPDGTTAFDTSQVTDMSHMFHNCKSLPSLDVSHFTTTSVTDMSYMFSICSSLTSLDISSFATSKVEDMQHMFSICTNLKDLTLGDKFNTSNVKNMDSMFYKDEGFQNIDNILSHFDTSNVENMSCMFQECRNLNSLDFSTFDTSSVTNMDAMFYKDKNLKELNLSYFNTSNVKSMAQMFRYCTGLGTLNFGDNFNTSKVTNMEAMFYGDENLKEINLKNFDMTSIIDKTKLSGMLSGLNALTAIELGEKNNIENTNITNKGYWVNVGKGTDTEPEASIKWTSDELMRNYDPQKNSDRYVRFDAIVTVHYKDKDSEKDLAPDKLIYGEVNKDYNETAKPIAGYTPTQATITGTYTEELGEITFFYTKNASQPTPTEVKNVTVHYLDENGNALVPSEILSGKIGDGYISSAKDIAGYTLKTRPTNATGFFSNQPQSVVYIYTKNGSSNSQTPSNNDNQSEKFPTSDNSKSNNNISNRKPRKRPQPVNNNVKNNVVNKTKADPTSTANSNKLPQTGTDKQSTLVVLFFGVLSVLTGLLGSWFNRKKE